jgi:hypothetical protein
VVINLMEAERIAPQILRYNIVAREILRELLKHEPRSPRDPHPPRGGGGRSRRDPGDHRHTDPGESSTTSRAGSVPEADAVLAAPLTFNTINKWAAGISDTLALGLLNEQLVEGLPIVAAPCVKAAMRTHPAYPASIERLSGAGAQFLDQDELVAKGADGAHGPVVDERATRRR